MSYYLCPHCGQREYLFGQGGAARTGQKLGAPVLGQVPLDPAIRAGGDVGQPVVGSAPHSASGQALSDIARIVARHAAARPVRAAAPAPALRIIS